jgi:hypothetical protein
MLDPNAPIVGRGLDSADDSSILSGIRTIGFHEQEVILTREITVGISEVQNDIERF